MHAEVLMLDVAGNPMDWTSPEGAALYYANGRVAWELGAAEHVVTLRGGINARSGRMSVLRVSPIVAVAGTGRSAKHLNMYPELPERGNALLFRRDRYVCAYCGERFDKRELTRDHIVPQARNGPTTWENCVTSCVDCNRDKGSLDVSQFRPLVYVPYRPCLAEQFILSNRTILADQMDYLLARVRNKQSRVLQ